MIDKYPIIRTLPEAAREIKKLDPGTKLTLPVLRRLVVNGTIPHVKSGRRILIDLNNLDLCSSYSEEKEDSKSAKIRKLSF